MQCRRLRASPSLKTSPAYAGLARKDPELLYTPAGYLEPGFILTWLRDMVADKSLFLAAVSVYLWALFVSTIGKRIVIPPAPPLVSGRVKLH